MYDNGLWPATLALLDGICTEATELLKDRQFSPELARALRKMKPTRQVECVELMVGVIPPGALLDP